MFGPGLALRGPAGSMKEAVDAMKQEQELTYTFFKIGVFFIHLSAALITWCYRDSEESSQNYGFVTATVVTVMLAISCIALQFFFHRIHALFKYEVVDVPLMSVFG
jgi:hypothetical protein